MDDPAIRALLSRLARPHPSGGQVIERAALLAAGSDFPDVIAWIAAHAGEPEATVPSARARGLHGTRIADGGTTGQRAPHRYVLPAGELTERQV
ncbi:MAG: hypothetical protein ACLP8S_26385 [Solirubrobacteraceae bacterium]